MRKTLAKLSLACFVSVIMAYLETPNDLKASHAPGRIRIRIRIPHSLILFSEESSHACHPRIVQIPQSNLIFILFHNPYFVHGSNC